MIMNILFSLVFFLVAIPSSKISSFAAIVEQELNEFEFDFDFDRWVTLMNNNQNKNNKYPSENERLLREIIWNENKVSVEKHNVAYEAGHTSWKMTMESPFADLTSDEFAALYLMDPQHCSATTSTSTSNTSSQHRQHKDNWIDDEKTNTKDINMTTKITAKDKKISVDWRTKGIMTPVKDQGHCGSCWTFSTSGCLEAHTCLAHNKDCTHWDGLAEQQLVDCAGDFNNFGCNGGLPSQAYEYIKYNGGMDLETSYTYEATDGPKCLAKDGSIGAVVAEVYNITSGDEDDLVDAISKVGPVSIAYQVSPDFRFYQHGVYDSYNATTDSTMCNNTNNDVNHAVVAVGLGTTAISRHNNNNDGGIPYYIVRNSWGTSWGMEGHFWMKRGENLCGVSDCASFPIVPTPKNIEEEEKEKLHQEQQYGEDDNKESTLTLEQSLYLRKK